MPKSTLTGVRITGRPHHHYCGTRGVRDIFGISLQIRRGPNTSLFSFGSIVRDADGGQAPLRTDLAPHFHRPPRRHVCTQFGSPRKRSGAVLPLAEVSPIPRPPPPAPAIASALGDWSTPTAASCYWSAQHNHCESMSTHAPTSRRLLPTGARSVHPTASRQRSARRAAAACDTGWVGCRAAGAPAAAALSQHMHSKHATVCAECAGWIASCLLHCTMPLPLAC